ncbi:MAG: hypothetical protein Q9162_001498 [Coniocarpon cinnabarinum]
MTDSPRTPGSPASHKTEIPSYEEAIEPADTYPVEISVQPKSEGHSSPHTPSSSKSSRDHATAGQHGPPEVIGDVTDSALASPTSGGRRERAPWLRFLVGRGQGWFRYVKTKEFWIVLLLGQVLSLCLTATNTFSELLAEAGTNIPAFQTFFNYVLLNLIFTTFTWYKLGFKGWFRLILRDGWKYFILSFCDVEGNYFIVLAYRYTPNLSHPNSSPQRPQSSPQASFALPRLLPTSTPRTNIREATILSVQLIDFWAIIVVVILSLLFLGVRYRITQYAGIVVCLGGMGLLIASDHITGANTGAASDAVKGDLFALLGATFYGVSNVIEEFAVSKRPLYEVVGQLAWWGMFINGVQCAIFDRSAFQSATWNSQVAGWLVGYTLILTLFYTLAPVVFRMSSAAFFNISVLTSDFWGVCIGVTVFHLSVYYLYPIAFVLIVLGMFVYFLTEGVMGESEKPWLGSRQEGGVRGLGTARWIAERRRGGGGGGVGDVSGAGQVGEGGERRESREEDGRGNSGIMHTVDETSDRRANERSGPPSPGVV